MNTHEILEALKSLNAQTVEVYAADRIPRGMTQPVRIVCNMDDHRKKGSHWVAIYIDPDEAGTYFDSYGLPPSSRYHIERLKGNCKKYRYSDKTLQSFDSTCCGQYTIMFLYHMCSGRDLASFHNIFTEDTRKNDAIAVGFYKKLCKRLYSKKCSSSRTNFFTDECSRGFGLCRQSCTSRLRCIEM